MPSQASPSGQSLLQLGVGLSGILNVLCPSAIASPPSPTNIPLSPNNPEVPLSDSADAQGAGDWGALTVSPQQNSEAIAQPLPISSAQLVPSPDPLAALSARATDTQHAALLNQLCQSLHSCDNEIAVNIDPSSATAVGELPKTQHGLEADSFKSYLVKPDVPEMKTPPARSSAAANLDLSPTAPSTPTEKATAQRQPEQSVSQPNLNTQSATIALVEQPTAQDIAQTTENQAPPEATSDPDSPQLDDELGTIRAKPIKRRDGDLGILRLLQTNAVPPPPKRPIAFLSGRLGYISADNPFRARVVENDEATGQTVITNDRASDQVYQSGIAFGLFPRLSENTSLYAVAGTNLGRFEQAGRRGYNEVELQAGIRQKLFDRTFAQIGWRNQRFYSFGYERKLLGINYIDARISHRSFLDRRVWLDGLYQARLGFADSKFSSRLRQNLTLSLNYAPTNKLRTSLLYQADLENYTEISRNDFYQQVIGTLSYRITPESRLSIFGGTRFGNSSGANPIVDRINLDDTFYGAGFSVNLPLF